MEAPDRGAASSLEERVRSLEKDLSAAPARGALGVLQGGELSRLMQEIEVEAANSDQRLGNGLAALVPSGSSSLTSPASVTATSLQRSAGYGSSALMSIQARADALAASRVAALDADSLFSSPVLSEAPPRSTTPRSLSPRFPTQELRRTGASGEQDGGGRLQSMSGSLRQTSSSSTSQLAKVAEKSAPNSPNGTSSLLNMVRREIEHLETRLNAQMARHREGADAATQKADKLHEVGMARLEQKVAQCESNQSKMDRKISELSGAVRGLSDEAQAQIRRSDMVDSRLYDFRSQIEEDFRAKLAEIGVQMQDVTSNYRVTFAALDDKHQKIAQQVKRLEGHVQELGSLDTAQRLERMFDRLETIEVGYQREAENTKAHCEDMLAGHKASLPRASELAANDPRLWQFEQELADLCQKVNGIFLEAHGERGWDARFEEHEVRLAAIRSKLDSQDAYALCADDRFRQEMEQKVAQLRKSIQDTAVKQVESQERLEGVVRSGQIADSAIDELRSWITESTRAEFTAQQKGLDSDLSATEAQRVDALSGNVHSLAGQLRGQESMIGELRGGLRELDETLSMKDRKDHEIMLDIQRKLAKSEMEMSSFYEQRAAQAISERSTQQSTPDGNWMSGEVLKEITAVAERVKDQGETVRKISSRLERLEMSPSTRTGGFQNEGAEFAIQNAVDDLREQFADIVMRMPSAEHLSKQMNALAELARQLSDVQRNTASQLDLVGATSPRQPQEVPSSGGVLAARIEQVESAVGSQLTEVWNALAELKNDGDSIHRKVDSELARVSPRALTGGIVEGSFDRQQLPAFDQSSGVGGSVVAQELGGLFQRVEEGEMECSKLQDQLKGRIASMDALLDKVAKEVLGPDGADIASAVALAVGAVETISSSLPSGLRLCILGGKTWNNLENRTLLETIARQVGSQLSGNIVVITTGMAGIQDTFVQSLGTQVPVVNLASAEGQGPSGAPSLGDRMILLGQLGDVYLTVEGGPTEAKEAKAAFARGAVLLPLICTGDSSAGMHDFPRGALRKPGFATEAQWAQLSQRGQPELTAAAVVEMLQGLIMMQSGSK